MRKNQGVTLIALVVTIIVLLILAGITVSALTGEKGIINQAKEAKEETEKSDLEEQIDIALIKVEAEKTNPTIDDVINKLIETGIIKDKDSINRETGDITTKNTSYVIKGKLDDYIINKDEVTKAISLNQTAEGSLSEDHEILQRIHALIVQAGNSILIEGDLQDIQKEIDGLLGEINRISHTTNFDEMQLLDGTLSYKVKLGTNSITISIDDMSSNGLGISGIDVVNHDLAKEKERVLNAIGLIAKQRGRLGEIQNNLDYALEDYFGNT